MKIVCISDTHNLHRYTELPEGDILIHAGDMTVKGKRHEIEDFNHWLGFIKDKYKHIVVIAGNHDFLFEEKPSEARKIITNAIYLENESVTIEGLKIWGSPITPWFHDWAFNKYRGANIKKYWDMIPDDTNILITHTPVMGTHDMVVKAGCVGCEDLYNRVKNLKDLKLFVCGHIHEGYGFIEQDNVKFVNASICTKEYLPINKPILIEL